MIKEQIPTMFESALFDQALKRISALEKAVFQAQPLPRLTDEHSPEVVRPQWEAIPQEEKDAGWWRVEYCVDSDDWRYVRNPVWQPDSQYRIVKTEKHPDNDRHARVKLEWSKVKDAGTHEIWAKNGSDPSLTWFNTGGRPCWVEHLDYEIRPIAKKLIDKSKLPIGAMTNYGRLMRRLSGPLRHDVQCWSPEDETCDVSYESLRIVPMTQWEVLQDGDFFPEGLLWEIRETEARHLGDNDRVRVFRIAGIADGWTDE